MWYIIDTDSPSETDYLCRAPKWVAVGMAWLLWKMGYKRWDCAPTARGY